MICISPLSIVVGKSRLTVPCGKCVYCLSNRRSEWVVRLKTELQRSVNCRFVTLTYEDKFLNYGSEFASLCKRDIQLFLKRIRRDIDLNCKKDQKGNNASNFRYFLCGEYGPNTMRPHYHAIFFNLPNSYDKLLVENWGLFKKNSEGKKEFIPFGFVTISNVTPERIGYVTKYIMSKGKAPPDVEQPFVLMSTKPAIGSNYLTEKKVQFHKKTLSFYVPDVGGIKQRMPRYYKDRIFNFKEKEFNYERTIEKVDSDWNKNINNCSEVHEYFTEEHESTKQNIERIEKLITKKARL